ncbi:MAG: serine/threonine-protein kinase [Cyanobacteria bacterium P01_D01_bin.50]
MLEAEQIFQQRYQLKQKLGQNAGRQTWLASDISIQPAETVILKFLAFGEQSQWDNLKLFEREADILKHLSHPRIPKYRDYFSIEDQNNWFALVQEYIPGDSLKKLIDNKQRFTEEELRKISTEILEILCYLHTLNPRVIHRDIKPSNLILNEEKKVYLIDFGAVQDSAAAIGSTFTVVGTYGYAPIEQFGGKTVPASDLYALGATLIHLTTGRIPAELPQKKMRIQFQEQVSLSDNFIRWIEKLTEPDIEERFSSAYQALEALNNPLAVNSQELVTPIPHFISWMQRLTGVDIEEKFRSASQALEGLNTNTSSQISKPYGSRIKLKKSQEYLEITIPGREIKFKDFLWIFLFFVFFGPLALLPAIIILLPVLGIFDLRLNRNYFVMQWKLFGYIYQQNMGKTSAINDVSFDYTSYKINNKNIEMISMKAGVKKYSFGAYKPHLESIERRWLIKEIKNWLWNQ